MSTSPAWREQLNDNDNRHSVIDLENDERTSLAVSFDSHVNSSLYPATSTATNVSHRQSTVLCVDSTIRNNNAHISTSTDTVNDEIPFLVTDWLAQYRAPTSARYSNDPQQQEIQERALQRIQYATALLSQSFAELGAYGTCRDVSISLPHIQPEYVN
jgi:hypothetical protein